jgi:hypothetical protein
MNFQLIPKGTQPRSFNRDTLEGNWYEDRCVSDYDKNKKKSYLLKSGNDWQYDTTYKEVGSNWKNFPKTIEKFSESNDNYINFQGKNNNLYITTNK